MVKSNFDIKNQIQRLRDEIKVLRNDIEVVDKKIYIEFHPEIIKMKNRLQEFFNGQKLENFNLIKQIAKSEKDKLELQQGLYEILYRIKGIEKDVGVRPKALTYLFDQTLVDNQIMDKILIEKEDI